MQKVRVPQTRTTARTDFRASRSLERPWNPGQGRTAARIAAWEGHHNIIKLIGPYSKLNQSDFEDRTPLFAACYMQHIDTVVQVNQINPCTVPLNL